MSDKYPMTPQGHAALKAELDQLRKVERMKIVQEIEEARAHGDLKENAEYHAARERQGFVVARMRVVEDQIARAEVIDPKSLSGSRVKFGATVVLEDEDGEEKRYRIVGSEEADVGKGSISVTSPVARALINREVGDEVRVKAPGGERVYEIVDVLWI